MHMMEVNPHLQQIEDVYTPQLLFISIVWILTHVRLLQGESGVLISHDIEAGLVLNPLTKDPQEADYILRKTYTL